MTISADNRTILKTSLNLLIRLNQEILKQNEIEKFTKDMLENENKLAIKALQDIKQFDRKR